MLGLVFYIFDAIKIATFNQRCADWKSSKKTRRIFFYLRQYHKKKSGWIIPLVLMLDFSTLMLLFSLAYLLKCMAPSAQQRKILSSFLEEWLPNSSKNELNSLEIRGERQFAFVTSAKVFFQASVVSLPHSESLKVHLAQLHSQKLLRWSKLCWNSLRISVILYPG